MANNPKNGTPSSPPALPAKRHATVLRLKKGALVVCAGRAAKVLAIVSGAQIWVGYLGTDDREWVSYEALSPCVETEPAARAKTAEPVVDEFEFERARAGKKPSTGSSCRRQRIGSTRKQSRSCRAKAIDYLNSFGRRKRNLPFLLGKLPAWKRRCQIHERPSPRNQRRFELRAQMLTESAIVERRIRRLLSR